MYFKEEGVKSWNGFNWLRTVMGSCEHGNEPVDYVKYGEM